MQLAERTIRSECGYHIVTRDTADHPASPAVRLFRDRLLSTAGAGAAGSVPA